MSVGDEGVRIYDSIPKDHCCQKIILDIESTKALPRSYIITQLKKKGFTDIANKLPQVSNPENHVHEVLREIADILNEERGEQFEDMLRELAPADYSSLKKTNDMIVYEMFKDEINWGRVVTFIVFSSHIVLYCAQRENLSQNVGDVVNWIETMMEERLHDWIEQQGGWQAFVQHYDNESWRVNLSTAILGLGVGLAAVIGGLAFLKKIHLF